MYIGVLILLIIIFEALQKAAIPKEKVNIPKK